MGQMPKISMQRRQAERSEHLPAEGQQAIHAQERVGPHLEQAVGNSPKACNSKTNSKTMQHQIHVEVLHQHQDS